jgi:hypothetical protein
MKTLYLYILLILLIWGCNNEKNCSSPPSELYFKIIKNNQEYQGNKIDSLQIFYYKNGIKNYIADLIWLKEINGYAISTTNVLYSNQLSTISGLENINQFFFQFPDNDIDTLSYKLIKQSNSSNCSYYQTSENKYNGKNATMEASLSSLSVVKFVE